ncbi:hypothetical protein BFJ66_g6108 [Fusarium oxysporum f. sp. cepae]|uniref:Uncharacterized protein n=1 Tax=Fusarium oxysporum f. sp. cepae TaxID=396571 RepID=A0A3L6NPE9_FUSOX|nr:hypothetical protein BFJ65_g6667 [Fusarium oxysporum f. sp. cepae]RKK51394.1 hypothetical protein BFJ66_g6108 [Fusarium oxysporum f. sp. cepae]RKK57646.1 hypothetical protein BFJ67_g3401 [Fusarium oxysporum f. sp. cepae]
MFSLNHSARRPAVGSLDGEGAFVSCTEIITSNGALRFPMHRDFTVVNVTPGAISLSIWNYLLAT